MQAASKTKRKTKPAGAAKVDAWMPLWIGAYLADTTHLKSSQHGAYLMLIMAYWCNGGPLRDDDECFQAITRTSPREWNAMRRRIAEFFQCSKGVWRHKRIEQELERARLHVAQRSAAGKASAAKRKAEREAREEEF